MRTSRGLDRLITFLDAVVAIAITLLVLPLIDVLGSEASNHGLLYVFSHNAGRFGAFVLTFAVIARFWVAHHAMVECIEVYDPAFILINLAWVLTIVFLPFATQVTAEYGSNERLAVATYIGTVAASSLCLSALALLVSRRTALRREGIRQEHVTPLASLTTSALMLLAFALGVGFTSINYWAMLLLLLTGPLERLPWLRAQAERQDRASLP